MTGTPSWWRKAGAALSALVLTLLAFGPSLDAIICGHEGGAVAAAADQQLAVLETGNPDVAGHPADGTGVCVHGHCHHGLSYVATDDLAVAESLALMRQSHGVSLGRVPTSDPKFQLMRPPRA